MRSPIRVAWAAAALLPPLLLLPLTSNAAPPQQQQQKQQPGAVEWIVDQLSRWGVPVLTSGALAYVVGFRRGRGERALPPQPPVATPPKVDPAHLDVQRVLDGSNLHGGAPVPRQPPLATPPNAVAPVPQGAGAPAAPQPPWAQDWHFRRFRENMLLNQREGWRQRPQTPPQFTTPSVDDEIRLFVEDRVTAGDVNWYGRKWFDAWVNMCKEESWGLVFGGIVTEDELQDACGEAYRRAQLADLEQYPAPPTAPLQVQVDSRGRVLPVAYPPGAPPPPTPSWRDAGGDETRGAGSSHNQPLASMRQTLHGAHAAVRRHGGKALRGLAVSASRGPGAGGVFTASPGRSAKSWVIRGRV